MFLEGLISGKEFLYCRYEKTANGRYQFKSGLASFVSKLTNQDEVLNLYSGNTTYSIAIYIGEYIGAGVHHAVILPNNNIVGGTANGSFFEGKCKITW